MLHRMDPFVRSPFSMALACGAAAIVCAGSISAQQPDATAWPALIPRLERAALTGAVAELRAVRGDLLRMLVAGPGPSRAGLTHYTIAYVAWRMAFLPGASERERDDLLEDAVERLETLSEAEPDHAEAHALLGGLYGAQIGRSPLRGVLLGPRAGSALERAARLAPGNPRVALLEGIGAFNTPAMFGGGDDKAERLLRRSAQSYAREPADQPWPHWGRADVHAWLGQVLQRKGDRAGARAEYEKGLRIAPEYGWIQYALLPSLERAGNP